MPSLPTFYRSKWYQASLTMALVVVGIFGSPVAGRGVEPARVDGGAGDEIVAGLASVDTVQIRGGGQVAGRVKRVANEKSPYSIVEVDPRLKVAIPENRVDRVVEASALAEYRSRVAAIAKAAPDGGDAETHYELARWCKQQSLHAQYRYHLQRTVRIDPDHSKARTALGFEKDDGQWIRQAQLYRNRGMVRVGGRYRLPAELMIAESKKEVEVKSKAWIQELNRLKRLVARGGDRGAEAWAALAAIDDPFAATAIGKELVESTQQPRDLRLFWIDKLAQLDSPDGLPFLIRAGLSEVDSVVREKALETLHQRAPDAAVAAYLPLLRNNDNATVRRAAESLSYFPDPELVVPLIDALVTKHKTVIPADTRTKVGFSNAGSAGMTTGGKEQTFVDNVQNPPVLDLLRQIESDVDYGYNVPLWRRHVASKLSGYRGQMRRDE